MSAQDEISAKTVAVTSLAPLSNAWKSIIIKYGVTVTHLHQAGFCCTLNHEKTALQLWWN
jgi:hypothetical protein